MSDKESNFHLESAGKIQVLKTRASETIRDFVKPISCLDFHTFDNYEFAEGHH